VLDSRHFTAPAVCIRARLLACLGGHFGSIVYDPSSAEGAIRHRVVCPAAVAKIPELTARGVSLCSLYHHCSRKSLRVELVILPEREANHSPSTSAGVSNAQSFTFTTPTRLYGVVLRHALHTVSLLVLVSAENPDEIDPGWDPA